MLPVFVTACSFSLAGDITPPPGSEVRAPLETLPAPVEAAFPVVPPDPASGAPIYAEKCAPCHGASGRGDGPQGGQLPNPPAPLGLPEFASQTSPAQWYGIVTRGNLERFMPPFNSLTDRQRWDVVAYALTLSASAEKVARGRELYAANCASCHGVEGGGDGPDAVGLSAAPSRFTDQERMAEVSGAQLFEAIGAGLPPAMPAFAGQLNEDERWDLVAFLRSLTFSSPDSIAEPAFTPSAEATGVAGPTQAPLASPQATGTGTITGQVINSTVDGELPEDLSVTLHGFDQMEQSSTASTDVLPDGTFTFEGVEMPEGRAYLASVEYKGVAYSSDVSVVEPGTQELSLPIPFYETTTDLSVISVDRLHLLFEYIEPNTLRVIELYIISNQSDRTLVGEEAGAPVLSFALPEAASNLQFEEGSMGSRYVQTQQGFGDTLAIRPGLSQHQVVYSYDLFYTRRLEFSHPIDLPVNAVVILLPSDGIKVSGDQLREMEETELQGITYQMYSTGRLEAGTELSLSVSGSPRGGAGLVSGSGSSLVIGLAAFGVALIVGGIWLYTRQRGERASAGAGEQASWGEGEDANTLLDAILALDDKFQAGELPEEAYRSRRAELKARLRELLAP